MGLARNILEIHQGQLTQGKRKASTLHQVVNATAETLNVPIVRTNEIEIEHRE